MKTLTAMIAASVLLIGATTANADYFDTVTKETIVTGVTDSRAAAYQAGADKLSSLKSASPYALADEVGLFGSDIEADTVHLDEGSYVTVQERLGADGKIGYVGVVNAGVSYESHDDDQ